MKLISIFIVLTGSAFGAPAKKSAPAATQRTTVRPAAAPSGFAPSATFDYNSFKLSNYKSSFNNIKNEWSSGNNSAEFEDNSKGVGFTLGVTHFLPLSGAWSLGTKPFFQYGGTGTSEVTGKIKGQNEEGQATEVDAKIDSRVRLTMLGVRESINYTYGIGSSRVTPFLELGVGNAWVKDSQHINVTTKVGGGKSTIDQEVAYKGSKIAFEAATGANWAFSNGITPFFRAGYRFLKIDKLKAEEEYKKLNIKKNDPSKDLNDKSIAYDMGGFNASVGLSYQF